MIVKHECQSIMNFERDNSNNWFLSTLNCLIKLLNRRRRSSAICVIRNSLYDIEKKNIFQQRNEYVPRKHVKSPTCGVDI